jgi:hypothetical protein
MLEVHKPELKIMRELHIIYAGVDPLDQRTSHFILLGDVYRCWGLFSQAKVVSSHLWVEVYLWRIDLNVIRAGLLLKHELKGFQAGLQKTFKLLMSVSEVWSLSKSWYLKVNLMVDEKRIKGEQVIPGYIFHSEECWYFRRNLSRVFWPLKRPISLIIIILPHILEILDDSPNLILILDDLTDFICPHKFVLDLSSSAFS